MILLCFWSTNYCVYRVSLSKNSVQYTKFEKFLLNKEYYPMEKMKKKW